MQMTLQPPQHNFARTSQIKQSPSKTEFEMAPMIAMHRAVQVRNVELEKSESLTNRVQVAMVPTPRALPGEVVVHMLCRPVHPADLLSIAGTYPPWQPPCLPATVGLEGMGVVHELGDGVEEEYGLKEGQRVFPYIPRPDLVGQGSWQEFVVAPAQDVFPIPDCVSDDLASQFYVNPWSALAMLRELNPQKGDYIIQSAAASTLGRMIIQVAHYYGFKTINLVRRNDQKAELKELGADEVINYMEENVVQRVKKVTKEKMAHGGLDCIGGNFTKTVMSSVAKGGLVLVYASLGGKTLQPGLANLMFRDVRLHGFWLSNWLNRLTTEALDEFSETVMKLLASGVFQTQTADVFPLALVEQAIIRSQEVGRAGKVLLVN
ncbi:uncharacterized protein [Physcomitrium patens]|uniref:Enoyl reductase (ER) domain-containing protein n=1 Tax=Physcomitrium patens TaxID=3218 RepID=A0A2K1LBP0_PHYPA|nr:enoyl-[acyl-carrier-protein] reductase, mitochondrial-like [Physcomitrium patens]PNR63448.1 hypothetical protein PHYPA_001874 [Physcomitrium patens]|eukprot:XP_024373971.1 enoyl-[acyl-carrier-protein] reductase, mitochondrial-like [Physcomitrella patens]